MSDHRIDQPFHEGELKAQQLAGFSPSGLGIRSQMPDQHRTFFPLLPFVCVAVTDQSGWPIASMVHGEPGFVSSPGAEELRVDALPAADDPSYDHLREGGAIGMLGIDLGTRRRNRANGVVTRVDTGGFSIGVRQSFGNCPKYIRVRQLARVERKSCGGISFDSELPEAAAALLDRCETLFVATASGVSAGSKGGGLDVSHRGGSSGFVRRLGDVLTIPDFAGNRFYNTLGNLLTEPRASIMVPDFETGDILQLQGMAEIKWKDHALASDPMAERAWTFRIVRGWMRRGVLPWGGE